MPSAPPPVERRDPSGRDPAASDLVDLDLLDGRVHGYCRRCLPGGRRRVEPGEHFPAVCGVDAFVWWGDVGDAAHVPRSACPDCAAYVGRDCPRCGARF